MDIITKIKNQVLESVLEETDYPTPNTIAINYLFDKQLHLISGAICFSSFIDNIKAHITPIGNFGGIECYESYFSEDVDPHFLDDDFVSIEFKLIWESYHLVVAKI